jgi:hypothetical protein
MIMDFFCGHIMSESSLKLLIEAKSTKKLHEDTEERGTIEISQTLSSYQSPNV